MTEIVLDASANVARVERGSLGQVARTVFAELLERHELLAPALHAWEVGNALLRERPRGRPPGVFEPGMVTDLLESLELRPPTTPGLRATGRLARRHRLTFYDAAYLQLAAEDTQRVLVAEDRALLRAAYGLLGGGRALSLADARDALAADEL